VVCKHRLAVVARGAAGFYAHSLKLDGLVSNDGAFRPAWTAHPLIRKCPDAESWAQRQYYHTMRADREADGRLVVVIRGAAVVCGLVINFESGHSTALPDLAGVFLDATGWANPHYYETMQFLNLNSNEGATTAAPSSFSLMLRGSGGVHCYRLDVSGTIGKWTTLPNLQFYGDSSGWALAKDYRTMRAVYRSASHDVVLTVRGCAGHTAYVLNLSTSTWSAMLPPKRSVFGDAVGFLEASSYETCRTVVDGADVLACGRGYDGDHVLLLNQLA
jgi:hypothetical protein